MNHQHNNEIDTIIIDPGTKRVFPSNEGFNLKRRLRRLRKEYWQYYTKLSILLIIWVSFTFVLMLYAEQNNDFINIIVPNNEIKRYEINGDDVGNRLKVILNGPFDSSQIKCANSLKMYVESLESDGKYKKISDVHEIFLENEIDIEKNVASKRTHNFLLTSNSSHKSVYIALEMNMSSSIPLQLAYQANAMNPITGITCGGLILLGMYVLIVFELVHRCFAAILASTLSLATLTLLERKPSMDEIVSWIDAETILLLFSMMILVAIISQTGIFDYLAVYAFEITHGKIWPLINYLAIFTIVLSMFLDNVTTILLMTPVIIRICEVVTLNPVPVLTIMVIICNVAGIATPVGDPPNLMIISNKYVRENGISFFTFTLHMTIGVILLMFQTYGQIRFHFRNMNRLKYADPHELHTIQREIFIWERTAASMAVFSRDDNVHSIVREKIRSLGDKLVRTNDEISTLGNVAAFEETLNALKKKHPIRDKPLLIKSIITLSFVILLFFLHSVPNAQYLSIGWSALIGVLLLLILSGGTEIDQCLTMVEWSTLIFFAALFVLMECLSELGFILWMGQQTEYVITLVDEDYRLTVAILLILWVSGLVSAFVDNIPLTSMMIKIVVSISENKELGLPLAPLIWALAFGGGLGGNGTLIAASSNIVCAGVAEQHGYKFSFVEFFKIGFPIMICNLLVATLYLLIFHVLTQWY